MTSCTGGQQDVVVPEKGELVYEIGYSENLRELQSVGAFLPHTAIGIYDAGYFKISTSAPLSFAKVTMVHGAGGLFMTLDINDMRLLSDFSPWLMNADSLHKNVRVSFVDGVVDICGLPSVHTTVKYGDVNGIEFKLDVFTAVDSPIAKDVPNLTSFNAELAGAQNVRLGLVTAFSLRFADSNIIFMLRNVRPIDFINPTEFLRPQGYIETDAMDLLALCGLM